MTFAAIGASLAAMFGTGAAAAGTGAAVGAGTAGALGTAAGAGGALAAGAGTIGEGLLAASPLLGEGLAVAAPTAGSMMGLGASPAMMSAGAQLAGNAAPILGGASQTMGLAAPLSEQLGAGASSIVQAPPMPVQSAPIAQAPPAMPTNLPPPKPGFLGQMGNALSDPNKWADQMMSMPGSLMKKVMGGGSGQPVQFAPPPSAQPMGQRMAAPQQLGGVVNVAPQGGGANGMSLEQIMLLRRLGVM